MLSGTQGAHYISDCLLQRYGEDSFEFIIDEGGSEVKTMYGGVFALPGTSEKGYLDVRIRISGKGGHSSVPPEHTTIGQLAKIIELVEMNPWEPVLDTGSRSFPVPGPADAAFFGTLRCLAEHSPDIPSRLRRDIIRAGGDDENLATKAMARVIREVRKIPSQRYLMGTSQAMDVINGGGKGMYLLAV